MMNVNTIRIGLVALGLSYCCRADALPDPALATGVDPTRPPNFSTDSTTTNFVLNAVMITQGHRLAVINNKIVHVGDKVGLSFVSSIDEDSVELTGSSGIQILRLNDFHTEMPIKIEVKPHANGAVKVHLNDLK